MKIEHFVAQSIGEWRAMRSSHSLAFQQFEEVVSHIKINEVRTDEDEVVQLLNDQKKSPLEIVSPFKISWNAESNWDENSHQENNSGSCILIPIPSSDKEGLIIRSVGYAEKQVAVSKYKFTHDETLSLETEYEQSSVEERIWFLSCSVRCRSSVIRTSRRSGILQTSFSSEVKLK